MKAGISKLATIVSLVLAEGVIFYFWTFLFMLEGAPSGHNSVFLRAMAWLCVALAIAVPLLALLVLLGSNRK